MDDFGKKEADDDRYEETDDDRIENIDEGIFQSRKEIFGISEPFGIIGKTDEFVIIPVVEERHNDVLSQRNPNEETEKEEGWDHKGPAEEVFLKNRLNVLLSMFGRFDAFHLFVDAFV